MITFDEAKNLKFGDILIDQRGKRWKVNGQVKLWKTMPERIRVPLKHGLRTYDYIGASDFVDGKCDLLTKGAVMKWIIITGNVVDGFIHYGPFDDVGDATMWAERELRNLDWTAAYLYMEVQ